MDSCTRLKLQTRPKWNNEVSDNHYNILCGLVVRSTDSHTCGRWFDSYLTHIFSQVYFFGLFLELNVIANICSVMLGRFPVFIAGTSSEQ